jgi:hypothetical protein
VKFTIGWLCRCKISIQKSNKDLLFDESKISEFKELVAKEPISEEKKKKFLKQQFEKVVKRCRNFVRR